MNDLLTLIRPACLILLAWPTAASADLVLELSLSGESEGRQEILASVGDRITLDVRLNERDGESRLSTSGLATFGLRGRVLGDALAFTDVKFNDSLFSDFTNSTRLVSSRELELVGETFTDRVGTSLLLGQFTVAIVGPGTSSIVLEDANPAAGAADFVLGGTSMNPGLDVDLFSSDPLNTPDDRSRNFSLRVTAVPEPGSCVLIAIAAAVTCRYRRRVAK